MRHRVGASFMLLAALGGFIAVAAFCAWQCVAARLGALDGALAGSSALGLLMLAARRWSQGQPVAFRFASDGLTTWNRTGQPQYGRITGCAQWSNRLLALTLIPADGRAFHVLFPADAVDREVFRELAVRARRAAHAVL